MCQCWLALFIEKCLFCIVSIVFSKVSTTHVPLGFKRGVLLTFLALFVCVVGASKMFFAFVVGLFNIATCVGGTFSLLAPSQPNHSTT